MNLILKYFVGYECPRYLKTVRIMTYSKKRSLAKGCHQKRQQIGKKKGDVVLAARLEAFRALKLSRLEIFRALQFFLQIGRF